MGRGHVKSLDEGTIHVPRGTKGDSSRFHHETQNGVPFTDFGIVSFWNFSFNIFLDGGRPRVTETVDTGWLNVAAEGDRRARRGVPGFPTVL